ncbi:hypothetical protein EZS27_033836 [termite gut metagenome]|uniref:Uncharacterized protein n=1 Tax=termite gut metagenome TaxID=433724 RepID=A0A5J4Q2Q4_9ZZZZ
MGTCFKYCVVSAVLIMLLYSPVVEAARADSTIQTSFFLGHTSILAQGQDGKQSVSFHDFFSCTLCDVVCIDSVHVPTIKNMLLFTTLFKENIPTKVSLYDVVLHRPFIYVSDPVTYYVFGLRKIVV